MTKDPFPMRSDEARRLQASVNDNNNNNDNVNNNNSDNGNEWNVMDTTTATYTRGSRNTGSNVSGGEAGLLGTNNNNNNNKKKKSSSGSDSDNINIYENLDEDKAMSKSELYMESQDEYLDNPIDSIHGSGSNVPMIQSCSSKNSIVVRALKALHKKLYGDKMPVSQLLKTLCLSSTLFFMIGGYWLLRSLKDPVLTALCGVTAIPKAKMLSVVVVLAVVSIYNKLLDDPNITKHSLFYKFGMFYFLLFTTISLLLKHPTIGLPNQEPSYDRILGWVSYCSIESFGSVMVSLFWSFANSNFDLEDAKASYGLLVATAQIGSIIGPTIVNLYANTWGVANIYFIGALFMLMLQACMYIYVNVYGTTETNPNGTSKNSNNNSNSNSNSNKPAAKKKGKAGVLEGLHLFVKYNYVKGIFAISCLFMVEVTIVDYTMKVLAKDHFTKLHPCLQGQSCYTSNGMSADATAAFTTFMGLFGQATNTLSFLLSFFGTSAVIRYLGLRLALLLFPTLCWIVIIMVRINPTLYVVFAAMMILKANSYALNNPTKEMLYQPTSSAVKYKAKSWIDIFGARGSKALGSLVTNAFSDSSTSLVANGSLVGIAVATFLIWNARFMGRSFEKYVESGYIVGSEEEEEEEDNNNSGISGGGHVSLAGKQNDTHDTSCAIYDEDEKEIVENVSDHSEDQNDDGDDNKNTKPQVEMV